MKSPLFGSMKIRSCGNGIIAMRFGPPAEVINEHFSEELGTASFLVASD